MNSYFDAARHGDSSTLYSHLDNGTNIDSQDPFGWSALSLAIFNSHFDLVIELLKRGAKFNLIEGNGYTPLMIAVYNKDPTITKELLDRGALPDQTRADGTTAIFYACLMNNISNVSLLIERGADPNHRNRNGGTPILMAAVAGHLEIVRLLINHSNERNILIAMLVANIKGHLEVVKEILNRGYDPNFRVENGLTALTCAISSGNLPLIQELVNNGAEIPSSHKKNNQPNTSNLSHSGIIRHLEDPDQVDSETGLTNLMKAIDQKWYGRLNYYLHQQPNLEEKDKEGKTALIHAIEKADSRSILNLIKAGAQIDSIVLEKADQIGDEKVIRILQLALLAREAKSIYLDLLLQPGSSWISLYRESKEEFTPIVCFPTNYSSLERKIYSTSDENLPQLAEEIGFSLNLNGDRFPSRLREYLTFYAQLIKIDYDRL